MFLRQENCCFILANDAKHLVRLIHRDQFLLANADFSRTRSVFQSRCSVVCAFVHKDVATWLTNDGIIHIWRALDEFLLLFRCLNITEGIEGPFVLDIQRQFVIQVCLDIWKPHTRINIVSQDKCRRIACSKANREQRRII